MVIQKRHSSQSYDLGAHDLDLERAAESLIQQLKRLVDNATAKEVSVVAIEVPAVVAIEESVLAMLEQIKQTLIDLKIDFKQLPAQAAYNQISQEYNSRRQQLATEHKQKKQQRDYNRAHYYQHLQGDALVTALSDLTKASQRESTERRRLKQEMENAIAPFTHAIAQADQRIQTLKQQYKSLSRQWQISLQRAYCVPETADPLRILYQDEYLIVIDKPAGLLSVPGRRVHLQDSVLSRLRHQLPAQTFLQPVHRLDQATSGVLAIALSPAVHSHLSQQFAQHQVHKTYEAILSYPVERGSGSIELPLYPDLENRPKQLVDFQKGKPSRTAFRRLSSANRHRVEFIPYTGRTHQLRVHAAHPQGLNSPIVGDTLYSSRTDQDSASQDSAGQDSAGQDSASQDSAGQEKNRLLLHATSLECLHPITQAKQRFTSCTPF